MEYVFEFLADNLSVTFNYLSKQATHNHLQLMFTSTNDYNMFKVKLRDYLVQLQHLQKDNDYLYDENKK